MKSSNEIAINGLPLLAVGVVPVDSEGGSANGFLMGFEDIIVRLATKRMFS